ncbi:MAG: hypothetical protein K0R49_1031, partial [Burkholderiales bacterium]|nr:hypothetical protein [Burkholderiales bacterium]
IGNFYNNFKQFIKGSIMEKSKDIFSIIISIIEKLVLLYVEHINRPTLADRLNRIAASIVKGGLLFILILISATTIWWGGMALLFIYLQLHLITIIPAILIIIGINVLALLITITLLLKLKNKHFPN